MSSKYGPGIASVCLATMLCLKLGDKTVIRINIFLGFAILGMFSLALNAAPTAVVSASRTSCVAPCGVVFDATATISSATSRPFHEIGYSWNFGDSTAGTWSRTNGRSQNTAVGAIAAHVFKTAGTFTVTLSARDSAGTSTNTSAVITVTSPDTAWAGTKTQCVSTSGNFTGCPAGANQVTSTNFAAQITWVNGSPGRRLLLRAGETWATGVGNRLYAAGPSMLGSFGGGSAIISSTAASGSYTTTLDVAAGDWRVTGLKIQGNGLAGNGAGIQVSPGPVDSGNNILIYDNEVTGEDIGIGGMCNNIDNTTPAKPTMIGTVYALNNLHDNGSYGLFTCGFKSAYIGNVMQAQNYHAVRIVYGDTIAFADNKLGGSRTYGALKLHAKSYPLNANNLRGPSSKFVEIAGNIFLDNTAEAAGIGPQNSSFNEEVHDVVLEGNSFAVAKGYSVIGISGYNFSLRNNLVDFSNNQNWQPIHLHTLAGVPTDGIWVYNNTFFTSTGNPNWNTITDEGSATNVVFKNNLIYNPDASANNNIYVALGADVISNNIVYYPNHTSKCVASNGAASCQNPQFLSITPGASDFLKISATSPAKDAGAATPVYVDYFSAARAGVPDIGFMEYASAAAAPTPAPAADFTASAFSGVGSLTTTFTATTTGAISSWKWDFGDGTSNSGATATVPSAVKFYGTPGVYSVSLTVTGPGGTVTKSKAGLISIAAAAATPIPSPTPTPKPVGSNTSTSGATTGATPTPSTTGLVAALGFDETAGATTSDASGLGNNGSISSATRVASGKFGGALQFNGTNAYVAVPDSASLDLTKAMTLEAWVYPQTTTGGGRTVIFKEAVGGASYNLYSSEDSNFPIASIFNGAYQVVTAPSALPLNQWSHVAATYDGANEKLYVNGAAVAIRPQTGAIQVSTGALKLGGNGVWGEWFKGNLDEVRVYNRALSATEIANDMKTPVNLPAIVVDNLDLNTQRTGAWSASGAANRWSSDALSTNDPASKFRWNPTVKTAGTYQVYAWWSNYAPDTSWRSSIVPYTVMAAGTSTLKIANQQVSGGKWNSLGTFYFDPAKANYIEVSAAMGWACADAVKLVRTGP